MGVARHFKKRRSIFGGILRLVIMVVVAYVVVLGVSAFGIYRSYQTAAPAFDSLEDAINRNDYPSAKQHAEVASTAIKEINEGLKGMQWDIARNIPVIGEDVRIGTEAASVAEELVTEAILPVLEGASGLTSNIAELDLVGTLTAAPGAVSALQSMRETLNDCGARADALPVSHFPFINGVSDKLREVTTETSQKLDAIDGLLGVADVVTDIFI